MDTTRWVVLVLVVAFLGLNLGLAFVARRKAGKLKGAPLPSLPGALGARIASADRAVVYFFTPTCAACRPVTPRMKALADQGSPVFPVNALEEPALAAALSVMATPTTVEVTGGRVVQVHIGAPPRDLWERFTPSAA